MSVTALMDENGYLVSVNYSEPQYITPETSAPAFVPQNELSVDENGYTIMEGNSRQNKPAGVYEGIESSTTHNIENTPNFQRTITEIGRQNIPDVAYEEIDSSTTQNIESASNFQPTIGQSKDSGIQKWKMKCVIPLVILVVVVGVALPVTYTQALRKVENEPPPQSPNTKFIMQISTTAPVEPKSIRFTSCTQVPQTFAEISNLTGRVVDIYTNDYQSGTEVYCDLKTDGGGWTVFQRRMDGSVNFTRNWNDYVNGFGNLESEFWMGLEKLHRLTSGGDFEVRFDLGNSGGNTAYAKYTTFSIGDASTKYRLSIGGYSGTAGDAMSGRHNHNNMMFSTYDEDNDTGSFQNCAYDQMGGWWFYSCNVGFLNGLYLRGSPARKDYGIGWYEWESWLYSLKFTEMKFRPKL